MAIAAMHEQLHACYEIVLNPGTSCAAYDSEETFCLRGNTTILWVWHRAYSRSDLPVSML